MPAAGTTESPSASIRKMMSNMRRLSVQLGIELDATDERPEEAVDHRRREAVGVECGGRGDVVAGEETGGVHATQPRSQQRDARLVEEVADRGGRGGDEAGRPAERVGHDRTLAVPPHERARFERLEVERVHVELAVHLGVGGEGDLEATVEGEAVDDVAADAAADAVGCFVHLDPMSGVVEVDGARQPGEACSDDDDGCVLVRRLAHFFSRSRQRAVERRVGEREAVGSRTAGHHLLPAEQQVVGEFATEHQLRAELRNREERGAARGRRRASW